MGPENAGGEVEDNGESQDEYSFCEYGKKTAREMAEDAVKGARDKIGAVGSIYLKVNLHI